MQREEADQKMKVVIEMKTGKAKSQVTKQAVEVDAVGGAVVASAKRQGKQGDPELAVHDDQPEDPQETYSHPYIAPRLFFNEHLSLEWQARKLPNYHGFVCREDLPIMLPNVGDWLLRTSIHPELKKKKVVPRRPGKPMTDRERKAAMREAAFREMRPRAKASVLISVNANEIKASLSPPQKKVVIQNLVIYGHADHYYVAQSPRFSNLKEIIDWASNNTIQYKNSEFRLTRGVPLLSWEFRHTDVQLLDTKLGEGAFGQVRAGQLTLPKPKPSVKVAVKMLKTTDAITRAQILELLHEARMMRVLSHPNVLKMYGIAVLAQPPMLMTELCTLGALREYLKENKCSLADKLKFVLGAAKGVEYMHSQNMIHRDLAARNIFLTSDKTPKVSDFGLARQTDRYEMKETCKVPVRYLSPETLESFIFTAKSDVFSFGCVIWEIYENGNQPYDGMVAASIRSRVRKREYLKLTTEAPVELRKLVAEQVFVADPENRCAMQAVVKTCEALVK